MTREFEHRHMVRQKCAICGCKNKVHTELLDLDNNLVGYSLTCCACGNKMKFSLDYKNNGTGKKVKIHDGKQTCIQPSFCPRKDCKLYGTCIDAYDNTNVVNHNPEDDKMPFCDNDVIVSHHEPPRFL